MENELEGLLIDVGWLLTKYITLPGLMVCGLFLFIYKLLEKKGYIK